MAKKIDYEKIIINRIDAIFKKRSKLNSVKNATIEDLYKLLSKNQVDPSKHEQTKYSILQNLFSEYVYQTFFLNNKHSFDEIKPLPITLENCIPNTHSNKYEINPKNEKQQCIYLVNNKEFNEKNLLFSFKNKSIKPLYFEAPISSRYRPKSNVDLITLDSDINQLILNEYKIPSSKENLFRAVSEILTYAHWLDIFNSGYYLEESSKYFKDHKIDSLALGVIVPLDQYKFGHRYAYELIDKYKFRCFTFKEDNGRYKIIELTKEQINNLKDIAFKNNEIVYKYSNLIVNLINGKLNNQG